MRGPVMSTRNAVIWDGVTPHVESSPRWQIRKHGHYWYIYRPGADLPMLVGHSTHRGAVHQLGNMRRLAS